MSAVIITMTHPRQGRVTRTFRVGDTQTQADEYQRLREEAGQAPIKRLEVAQ